MTNLNNPNRPARIPTLTETFVWILRDIPENYGKEGAGDVAYLTRRAAFAAFIARGEANGFIDGPEEYQRPVIRPEIEMCYFWKKNNGRSRDTRLWLEVIQLA